MGNELGQFLEELRGKLSLRDAAEKSGLSHTYIRDLELGLNRKTKAPIRPSADTLIQLAKAYNCPPNDLLKVAGYIEEDAKTPEDSFDDPELNIFFKEIKDESPERREQLMKIWKIIKSEGK
jgi:transcriptional regulator with XRE-family HTH domain